MNASRRGTMHRGPLPALPAMTATVALEVVSLISTGLFAGAAIYVTVVEHPARLECGVAIAVTEFAPSYRRAAVMQAGLAALGSLAAIAAWAAGGGMPFLIAGALLGSVIPFTLVLMRPINARILDPSLDRHSLAAGAALRKWGRFHAVRSIVAGLAFVVIAMHLTGLV